MRAEGEAIDGRGEAFQGPAGDAGKFREELKAAVKLVLVAVSLRGAELPEALGIDVFEIGNRLWREPVIRHGPGAREPQL